jgi:hypothetical protein
MWKLHPDVLSYWANLGYHCIEPDLAWGFVWMTNKTGNDIIVAEKETGFYKLDDK